MKLYKLLLCHLYPIVEYKYMFLLPSHTFSYTITICTTCHPQIPSIRIKNVFNYNNMRMIVN